MRHEWEGSVSCQYSYSFFWHIYVINLATGIYFAAFGPSWGAMTCQCSTQGANWFSVSCSRILQYVDLGELGTEPLLLFLVKPLLPLQTTPSVLQNRMTRECFGAEQIIMHTFLTSASVLVSVLFVVGHAGDWQKKTKTTSVCTDALEWDTVLVLSTRPNGHEAMCMECKHNFTLVAVRYNIVYHAYPPQLQMYILLML